MGEKSRRFNPFLYLLYTLVLIILLTPLLIAQETEDTQLKKRKDEAGTRDAEAKATKAEIELESTKAEARKAKAEARAQEITNRENELKLLQGSTQITGDLVETDISTYQAISCAALPIQTQINGRLKNTDVLMVYNPQTAKLLTEYSALMTQVNSLNKSYEDIFAASLEKEKSVKILTKEKTVMLNGSFKSLKTDVTELFNPVNAVISTFVDVLSLFKTDTKITGKKIEIGKDEFISLVANGLRPAVYNPEQTVFSKTPETSALLESLVALGVNQGKSANMLKEIAKGRTILLNDGLEPINQLIKTKNTQIADLEEQLAAASVRRKSSIETLLQTVKAELKLSEAQLEAKKAENKVSVKLYDDEYAGIVKKLSGLNAAVDYLSLQINPPAVNNAVGDENEPETIALLSYLQAEAIQQTIRDFEKNQREVYWFDVKVAKAGGNMRERGSPITDIFTGGKRISFSGEAIVMFKIFDSDSRIVVSNLVKAYSAYQKSSRITNFKCQTVQDTDILKF